MRVVFGAAACAAGVMVLCWRRRRRAAFAPLGEDDAATIAAAEARGARWACGVVARLASPLAGQVGGHLTGGFLSLRVSRAPNDDDDDDEKKKTKKKKEDDERYVLKPMQSGARGVREVALYEHAPVTLRPFLCEYHGVLAVGKPQYVVIDDITRGMRRPCVLDAKLGTVTFEPEASAEKRAAQLAKYAPQSTFGVRLVGARYWRAGEWIQFEKKWGFSLLSRSALLQGLEDFFGGLSERPRDRAALLRDLERQLLALLSYFEENHELAFISSSLLFAYDAAERPLGDGGAPLRCEMRMIDFAHVRRADKRDDGYVVGLHTLLALVRDLEAKCGSGSI